MPRPCHALTMPFFSRPRHSTAAKRRPVGYLTAFGFFRLRTSSSNISGYHEDFHEGHGTVAGARHGMYELTHGMAGERHGHGMLCVNPPLLSRSQNCRKGLVASSCLSDRVAELGFQWADFYESSYLRAFRKSFETTRV
jgi:hypothetical protein